MPAVRTTFVEVSVARVGNSSVDSGTCGREQTRVHGVMGEPEGQTQVAG